MRIRFLRLGSFLYFVTPAGPPANRRVGAVVAYRTEMSDAGCVKDAEFQRPIQKLARSRKLTSQFVGDKGQGSDGRMYLGGEFTTLKDRKKEIGKDLLATMCRDLGVDPHDL